MLPFASTNVELSVTAFWVTLIGLNLLELYPDVGSLGFRSGLNVKSASTPMSSR